MSDSVRPHRRQPTRLLCPWDSPGKNAGVGCHFLLQCMKVKSQSEVAQSCLTLSDPMDCSLPGSSVYGIFQARVLEWGAIAFSISILWRIANIKHIFDFGGLFNSSCCNHWCGYVIRKEKKNTRALLMHYEQIYPHLKHINLFFVCRDVMPILINARLTNHNVKMVAIFWSLCVLNMKTKSEMS